jgi:signal transduction histidine kinase
VAMIVIITYAIIRHRLMDLRIIFRDLITKAIMIAFLSAISGAAAVFYGLFSGFPVHKGVLFPIVGAMTLTALIFPYLASKTRELTRKYIVKGGYDPEILSKRLVNILSSTIGFNQMLQDLLKILIEGLNVSFASLLLIGTDQDVREYRAKMVSTGKGFSEWPNVEMLLDYFKDSSLPLVKEEFIKKPDSSKDKAGLAIVKEMDQREVAIILPLIAKKKLTGFLFLGDKPATDSFTINDLSLLETFASQASFAIENARLFAEIQTFNEKLREEVKRATHELRDQNRFLAALRRLDLIIMEALEVDDLCQKIVDALSLELECQFGIIGTIDEVRDRFYFKAGTAHSELAKLLVRKKVKIDDIYFSLNEEQNPLTKVINTKRELSIESLDGIFSPFISTKRVERWQKELKTKTYWIYPIASKKKVIGVLIFGWKKAEREISSKERDLMQSVIDQTGIALENTFLYDKLKAHVKKLKRANFKLRELDRMKDEFVSIASHELRTPMTSINNYIWMVLHGKAGKVTRKQQFYLDRAAISTKRLINLVEDMLTVSRIEGGKLEANIAPGNIFKLAKSTAEEIEPRFKTKKIKLFLESPKKELPLVMMDQEKIREVFLNLLGNALKFTDSGGEVTISFKKKGPKLLTTISDTGRGIAKADIPKLFKKFGRLDRSFVTVAETGGTGLGLYICKQILDLHRSKIGVKSKVNQGSHFHFDLKIAKKSLTT